MFKPTSRRGSAKVVVLLLIVAFLGAMVVGAGALYFLNGGKLNLTKKEKDEVDPQSSESAASTPISNPSPGPRLNSLSSGGAGLIPVKQLDAISNARKKVVSSAPIHANERIFASYAKRTDVLVLVDYYADWCPPCRKIAPLLSKLAAQHGDKVIVLKVNTDREQALASRAGVRSIPDVRLMHGGKQLERYVGERPYRDYEAIVLKHERRLTKSSSRPQATAKAIASAPRPALRPSAPPRPSKPDAGSPGRGSITPAEKDWLPPGVTRAPK